MLLPGAACGPGVWEPLVEALAPRFAVEVGVVAGFGAEPPDAATSWGGLRSAVIAHLAAGPPAILVGHSLGGTLALDAALAHPVDGVVLIESGPALGPLVYRTDDRDAQRARAAEMVALADAGDAFVELLVASMRPMFTDPESFAAVAREAGLSEPRVVAELLAALVEVDLRDALSRLSAPVLHLVGADGGRERVAAFRAQTPEAELLLVPGSRHFPMVERPQLTAAQIDDWIGRSLSKPPDRGL